MPTTIPAAAVTATLVEVRRQIQDLLADLIVLENITAGGTTTATDTVHIFDSNDSYVGSHLYAVSGTAANVGKLARIDGSDQAIGTLSFTPAYPAAVAAGDVLDLHNLHGNGWTRAEVVRRIQQKLRVAFPRVLIDREDTIAGTFDYDEPRLTVPDDVTHTHSVEVEGDEGEFWAVPPGNIIYRKARREIEITGWPRGDAHGNAVRLLGYGSHPTVSADADRIAVDVDWLVNAVASELAGQKVGDPQLTRWAAGWEAKANALWQDLQTKRENNTFKWA